MATHGQSLPDPEALGSPDVGFLAAVGVYVAAVLVGASVSIALAADAAAPTVVGSVSTAVTVGLLAGIVLADRIPGLAERLGRSRRLQALLFVVPAVFATATIGALAVAEIPAVTVVGTGLGAFGTGLAALGLGSMSRTRYARAMTADEPVAQFPLRKPNRGRTWILAGAGCLAAGLVLTVVSDGLLRPGFWLFIYGTISLLAGLSHRRRPEDREEKSGWRPRRRILGSEWLQSFDAAPDTDMLPELRVHEGGLVRKAPMQRRFVPWTAVADVRLTEDELVFERDGWFDIRCDRSEIDDPEAVYEEVRRVRVE